MANLYRKPNFHTDPKTGERIKTMSAKWWGQFRDSDGRLRRHPLAKDKTAAQAMLNELILRVEREKAGLIDRTDEQRKRPLKEHVAEFEKYLYNKGISDKQAGEVTTMVRKIVAACKWKRIGDINIGALLEYFNVLRRKGRAAQTRNNYLRAIKQFTRWLVRDQRTPTDLLQHVQGANVATDRRHDRRPLSDDEFARMVAAAEKGGPVESICGTDRAMLYKLAAWTGFRRTELGSLTLGSLSLDTDPATATVVACYAKGKRDDTQPLHEELAKQLKAWLKKKRLAKGQLLFPIAGKVPGGIDRKTAKMVRKDLATARAKWIKEAKGKKERERREQSDFLCYQNHEGRFADFHACRHLFISNLERSGVSPKMAQTLARHKDIRLTLGIYTHIETEAKTKAIGSLPAPPSGGRKREHILGKVLERW